MRGERENVSPGEEKKKGGKKETRKKEEITKLIK